jgi:hypothetical protein
VDPTGRQVPGFVKRSIEPVINNGRYTLRTQFTGPGGYGDYVTQFDMRSRTFVGTGNTGTVIRSEGALHNIGLSTSVREEAFRRFTRDVGRPRGFDLQVEHFNSRAVLQAHVPGDMVETPISRAVFEGTFIGEHTAAAGEAVELRIGPRVALMTAGGGETVFATGAYRLALGLVARRLAGWLLGPIGMAATVGVALHQQSPAGRAAAAQEDAEASNAQSNLLNARLAGFLEPGHFDAWLAKELGCRDCWSDARTMAGVVGWKSVYLQEVEMQREQGFDVAVDREKMMSSVVYNPENAEKFLNQLHAKNPQPTSIGVMR